MHDTHVGEYAELYALGMLSAAEAAEVDAHLATCGECRRFVGKAEETVLALESSVKRIGTPFELDRRMHFEAPAKKIPKIWLAVAAAFILGLLPSVALLVRHAPSTSVRDVAAVAMLHSHFQHAQFAGNESAPRAKVIYARDSSWIYVVVEGQEKLGVYAVRNGRAQALGTTQPQGSTSELFVRPRIHVAALELRTGDEVVARAQLP